ncbi:hypothetical protein X797_003107 [Metarhizium robertsii]|uniref:Uncharacterized protein n=1 Tax=Metarhizium robertsii TaxID=568076 RepID=A0A0A1UZ45_9HYPO|nr:hypothetical protein X797_003107 [Metarhizium robertsii]
MKLTRTLGLLTLGGVVAASPHAEGPQRRCNTTWAKCYDPCYQPLPVGPKCTTTRRTSASTTHTSKTRTSKPHMPKTHMSIPSAQPTAGM